MQVPLELTKEGEVDEREVVKQQKPEEFACMSHTVSAWLHTHITLLWLNMQHVELADTDFFHDVTSERKGKG